jgi:SAM-dependent methyltransferase
MDDSWGNWAELRKDQIEKGLDITFSKIFVPYFTQKIQEISPRKVLEIGSGTGHLAKELKKYTSNYIAIEPSLNMFNISKEVLKGSDNINILNIGFEDLSKEIKYKLILSHLCAHAIPDVNSFLETLRNLLDIDGRAIFTLPHPCFYNDYKKFFSSANYDYNSVLNKDVSFSITNDPTRLITNVPYYHRPISFYINAIAGADLVIVSFDEIYPSDEVEALYKKPWGDPRYCSFILKR